MSQVFISYRQTDGEQRKRVRAFAERLRDTGIDVILDQFFLDENPGGPSEGWPKWSSDRAVTTDYILIVGTKDWFEAFDKTRRPGIGLGAASEADDIRQRLYEAGGVIDNIRVVLFDDAEGAYVPAKLRGYHRFQAERDFTNIVRWLGGVPVDTFETSRSAKGTISDLVNRFYDNDPLDGEQAASELLEKWKANAIESLVPLETALYRSSPQVELRLRSVASRLGVQIVPHLVRAISSAPWGSKMSAAICFSGLRSSHETEDPLIEILRSAGDFDAERLAIESLGRLDAQHLAYDLERFAMRGVWKSGADDNPARISDYAFEKLSSFVLEALTRFAAKASDRGNADRMFRDLASFIILRQTHLPNRSLNSYMLVERLSHEFTVWSIDPMIEHWGGSSDENLQRLCTDILREVAPVRAARFLLETAISPKRSDSVRRGASLALAELRVPQVAQRLANALRDPKVDRTYLDWPFSTLFALPIDWSGLSGYVDELLRIDNEPADQLHYSLAFRRDSRYHKDLVERLDDYRPFTRWTSALALARLAGQEAKTYLEHRVEDAGDPVERCAMYAAMIRVGDYERARDFHKSLTDATEVSSLASIWKLEILDAFRSGTVFDERTFPLWRDASRIGTRQLQYFDAMCKDRASNSPISTTAAQPMSQNKRTKIFISYSHKDSKWLQRLQIHLKPLGQLHDITPWDDTLIKPGENWREMIKRALEEAKVAILLISADFLASDFINSDELPPILSAAVSEGLVVFPIVISSSRFFETKSLSQFQSVNSPSQPVNMMPKAKQESLFLKVSRDIEKVLESDERSPSAV
jgi:hypothetical protein